MLLSDGALARSTHATELSLKIDLRGLTINTVGGASFPRLLLPRGSVIRRRIDPSLASNGVSSRFLLTENVRLGIQPVEARPFLSLLSPVGRNTESKE